MLTRNTNSGRTIIDRTVLPALIGSDKQIAWATELRDRRINKLCADFDNIISNARSAGRMVSCEEIERGRAAVWAKYSAEILEASAKTWIERR